MHCTGFDFRIFGIIQVKQTFFLTVFDLKKFVFVAGFLGRGS